MSKVRRAGTSAPKPPAPWFAETVVRFALADLIPYARNARTHTDAQVSQLAAMIREYGFTVPILVDEVGGIIAGHGRVLAADKLKLDSVPAIVARGWSEPKIKAYRIADNRMGELSSWDRDMLAAELADLAAAGVDLLHTGFSVADLESLTAPAIDAEREWQDMPEFEQQSRMAFHSIVVHFRDAAGVLQFAQLLGEKLTEKTKFVWYPHETPVKVEDKRYLGEAAE